MSAIAYRREGLCMVPLPRFQNEFGATYEDGSVYRLAEVEERSGVSHRHFFAAVNDGWSNLPEEYAQEFQTAESLRKYCLIKTGWFEKEALVLSSKDDALKVASWARRTEDYAIITVNDCTMTRYVAKSQSVKAMGKEAFQKSKQDVLDMIASMIGVDAGTLSREAGQAA